MIIEQLGSTEMPAVAWRTRTASHDSGYVLSSDRYDFRSTPTREFQPFVVRDRWPERALPVDDWFVMDDDARFENGRLVEIRRKNDRAWALHGAADDLLRRGVVGVQFVAGGVVRCDATEDLVLPDAIVAAGSAWNIVREKPRRLHPSNKTPLWSET